MNKLIIQAESHLASLEEELALKTEDPTEQYLNYLIYLIGNKISMLSDEVANKLNRRFDSYLARYGNGRAQAVIWLLEAFRIEVDSELLKAQEKEFYTDDSMVRQLINVKDMRL